MSLRHFRKKLDSARFNYDALESKRLLSVNTISPEFQVPADFSHLDFEDSRTVLLPDFPANFLWLQEDSTVSKIEILPKNEQFDPRSFTRFGDQYVFEAGDKYWITDGSVQGTQRISPELVSETQGVLLGQERLFVDRHGLQLGQQILDRQFTEGQVIAAERIDDHIAFLINDEGSRRLYLTHVPPAGVWPAPSKFITTAGQGADLAKLNNRFYFANGDLRAIDPVSGASIKLESFGAEKVVAFEGEIFFTGANQETSQIGVWTTRSITGNVELALDTSEIFGDVWLPSVSLDRSNSGAQLILKNSTRNPTELWAYESAQWTSVVSDATDLILHDQEILFHHSEPQPGFYRAGLDGQSPELLIATDLPVTRLQGISGNRLTFTVENETWVTDFTEEGTQPRPVFEDELVSEQTYLVHEDNLYVFSKVGRSFTRNTHVWRYNFSSGDTTLIGEYIRGAGGPVIFNNQLHFLYAINLTELAFARYDSDTNETSIVFTANYGNSVILERWETASPGVYYSESGRDIFRWDLNTNSSRKVPISTNYWTSRNDSLVYRIGDSVRLYDGVTNSTVPLRAGRLVGIDESQGIAYYATDEKIWRTDGTLEGTVDVHVFSQPQDVDYRYYGLTSEGRFYFAEDSVVWVSDGTPNGTRSLGVGMGSIQANLVHSDGFDFFFSGRQFIRTDGTSKGTEVLQELEVSVESLSIYDNLFIFTSPFDSNDRLLVSDGANTPILLGEFDSVSDLKTTDEGVIFNVTQRFTRTSSSVPSSWITDGTVLGTRKLFDHHLGIVKTRGDGTYIFEKDDNSVFNGGFLEGSIPASESSIIVNNTNDTGPGSLRHAIELAEAMPGRDVIRFNLPANSVIRLDAPLPDIRDSVSISYFYEAMTTHTSASLEIDGSETENASGLRVFADNVVIQGLGFSNFDGDGILVYQGSDVRLSSNNLSSNGRHGIRAFHSPRLEILGNQISENQKNGILLTGPNLDGIIYDNEITSNSNGIAVKASFNNIFRNVVEGNRRNGIGIFDIFGYSNVIQNNTISENGHHGIYNIADKTRIVTNRLWDNTLNGVYLKGADANRIESNSLLSELSTPEGLGGIRVIGSSDLLVTGNRISDSQTSAIFIGGRKSIAPIVANNRLSWGDGLGANGLVLNGATNGYVADNQIYANEGGGIYIQGSMTHHLLESNYVGFFSFSSTSNSNYGLLVASDGNAFVENQFLNADRNVIVYGNDNEFYRNWFGTNEFESQNVEAGFQVFLGSDASRNQIVDNVFANGFVGIRNRSASTSNLFSRNEMRDSIRFGIDNGSYRLDPSDPGDADNGPNRMQNHPNLASASLSDSLLSIRYSVDTAPANSTYPLTIEFFLASSDRVGEVFLEADLFTESDFLLGTEKLFEIDLGDLEFPVDSRVVATATDADGNTSEFSFEVAIQ